MRVIIISLIAASLAYVLNTIILRKLGLSVLLDIIPIIEEIIKTYSAVRFSVPIIYVHLLFGIVEAYSDFRAKENMAALMSIISHSLFGVIAFVMYKSFGILWSIAVSSAAHMVYNKIMLTDK